MRKFTGKIDVLGLVLDENGKVKKEKITKKEAFKKYDVDYIFKKYPKFKKELSEPYYYYNKIKIVEFLAVDRAYRALGIDDYSHEF